MSFPYSYVRYSWFENIDIELVGKSLESFCEVIRLRELPPDPLTVTHTQERLLVKSDTLGVFLSPMRAVMFQKKKEPFTSEDVRLREMILARYPHSRPTPMPWAFQSEPPFLPKDHILYTRAHLVLLSNATISVRLLLTFDFVMLI